MEAGRRYKIEKPWRLGFPNTARYIDPAPHALSEIAHTIPGIAPRKSLICLIRKPDGFLANHNHLKSSIRAILEKPGGQNTSVTLPAGAVLYDSSQPSGTLFGLVGVCWEGRHYSVYPRDLLDKTGRVSTA